MKFKNFDCRNMANGDGIREKLYEKTKIIAPHMTNALRIISQKLEGTNVKWAIVGSCALALHGVDIKPCDIDILTDKQGAFLLNELLKEYEIIPASNVTTSGIFESYLGRFSIDNVHVDVMGDLLFKSKFDNKWHSATPLIVSPEIIEIDTKKIPVPSMKDLLEMYEKWGRKKDLIKVSKAKNMTKDSNYHEIH